MPAVVHYPFGSLVQCSTQFLNLLNVLYDPTTVTFKQKTPTGVITILVYGIDVSVVKDGVGLYHCNINANVAGSWWYRFTGDNPQAANEQRFDVDSTQF